MAKNININQKITSCQLEIDRLEDLLKKKKDELSLWQKTLEAKNTYEQAFLNAQSFGQKSNNAVPSSEDSNTF